MNYLNVFQILFLVSCETRLNLQVTALSLHSLSENVNTSSEKAIRNKRQVPSVCDFGTDLNLVTCDWINKNGSSLAWNLGAGSLSNWIGGPSKDAGSGDDADRGGYLFFETSLLSAPVVRVDDITIREGQNAYIQSPIMNMTGAEGKCISFSYAIEGLSATGLQVLLQPINKNGHPESFPRVLWETKNPTKGFWIEAQTLYTFNAEHQIIIEGIGKELIDPYRKFRGYVAIDNVAIRQGLECRGHCSFEGGFCGWTNEEDDDFNWFLSRGSRNPLTGPSTDKMSSIFGGMEGGFAYMDSSFPRRPADVATLSSAEFEPTNPDYPMCMQFWTHMFGNGIGSLTVSILDMRENQKRDIWILAGDAGNTWFPAAVPISNGNPFKIIISAKTGKNNLGDMAIDDIAFNPGPCPTAPQIAAPQPGDCTFEVDECGWTNVASRDRLDDIDWERASGVTLRNTLKDHTLGNEKGSLLMLTRNTLIKPGNRAWFSNKDLRVVQPSTTSTSTCLSFWYIMNEQFVDASGPNLGALSVYVRFSEKDNNGNAKMKPVWRLYNHQGPDWQYAQASLTNANETVIIEGMWGSSRVNGIIVIDDVTFFSGPCNILPREARVKPAECHFDRDMCEWTNLTDKSAATWRQATVSRRPANLSDKTFGAPDGYVYFDLFNQVIGANKVSLISPVIPASDEPQLCISFWYAAFGAGESAIMTIIKQETNSSDDSTAEKIWSLEAKNIDTTRPIWMPAQLSIDSSKDFFIVLEGQATNGGFAVDDISFTSGSCTLRPDSAAIKPALPE